MSEKSSAVAALPVPHRSAPQTVDVFADPASFDHAQRVAKVLASSKLVPPHFQGNVADCLIALQIARRLNEEPMTVCQQLYIVNGKPGWSTAYMISRVNRSGILKGPITWDETGSGDALTVTAKAIISEAGEEIRVTTDMRMATAEGWTKNPKYKSMPAHMLRWRSAAMLIRLYAPEVMLGMPVVEEIETAPPMRDVTPAGAPAASLKDALDTFAATGNGAPQAEPEETTDQAAAPAEATPPKTSVEYALNAREWIGELTDADAGEARWKSEKGLRNKLNLNPGTRDILEGMLKETVAALRAKALEEE
jgi:hypothetical protein